MLLIGTSREESGPLTQFDLLIGYAVHPLT